MLVAGVRTIALPAARDPKREGRRLGPTLSAVARVAALATLLTASAAAGPARAAGNDKAATGVSDQEALLEHASRTWTGDLDGMIERGFIRVLTTYSPLFFYYDGAGQKGLVYEVTNAFAKQLNKGRSKTHAPVRILLIPTSRDQLLSALNEGRGDLVAANLTITPAREKMVAFSDPLYPKISELVVSGPAAPALASLDDLVQSELHLRPSSSYFEHLSGLNGERKAAGKPAIPVHVADENLEDYDLLEMVNAGMIPAIVVDSHKAALWAQVFDKIKVHKELAIHTGGNIAWAMRKDSTKLRQAVNAFAKQARKGTLTGNVIIKRYFGNTKWVDNAVGGDGLARYQATIDLIKRYAEQYAFGWLMIMAQGYQESKLDQSKVSHVGAVGIMQVMPKTASDPNINVGDIKIAENNVHAGVKYLRFLRQRYFSDPAMSPVDQVLMAFAAYNAGPGNISKARKRAVKMGLDPNVWFANVEVAAARAISREPVIYVRNIYKYYVAYKLLEEGRARRDHVRAGKK